MNLNGGKLRQEIIETSIDIYSILCLGTYSLAVSSLSLGGLLGGSGLSLGSADLLGSSGGRHIMWLFKN